MLRNVFFTLLVVGATLNFCTYPEPRGVIGKETVLLQEIPEKSEDPILKGALPGDNGEIAENEKTDNEKESGGDTKSKDEEVGKFEGMKRSLWKEPYVLARKAGAVLVVLALAAAIVKSTVNYAMSKNGEPRTKEDEQRKGAGRSDSKEKGNPIGGGRRGRKKDKSGAGSDTGCEGRNVREEGFWGGSFKNVSTTEEVENAWGFGLPEARRMQGEVNQAIKKTQGRSKKEIEDLLGRKKTVEEVRRELGRLPRDEPLEEEKLFSADVWKKLTDEESVEFYRTLVTGGIANVYTIVRTANRIRQTSKHRKTVENLSKELELAKEILNRMKGDVEGVKGCGPLLLSADDKLINAMRIIFTVSEAAKISGIKESLENLILAALNDVEKLGVAPPERSLPRWLRVASFDINSNERFKFAKFLQKVMDKVTLHKSAPIRFRYAVRQLEQIISQDDTDELQEEIRLYIERELDVVEKYLEEEEASTSYAVVSLSGLVGEARRLADASRIDTSIRSRLLAVAERAMGIVEKRLERLSKLFATEFRKKEELVEKNFVEPAKRVWNSRKGGEESFSKTAVYLVGVTAANELLADRTEELRELLRECLVVHAWDEEHSVKMLAGIASARADTPVGLLWYGLFKNSLLERKLDITTEEDTIDTKFVETTRRIRNTLVEVKRWMSGAKIVKRF